MLYLREYTHIRTFGAPKATPILSLVNFSVKQMIYVNKKTFPPVVLKHLPVRIAKQINR